MVPKASLQFKGYEIIKVVFDKPLNYSNTNFQIDVNHIAHVDKSNNKIVSSEFVVNISDSDKKFNLIVQTIGHFEITGEVSEDIYNNYINISSPSIVYPYIRAFITNIVIQAGMQPIIIPPLNFANRPSLKTED